MEADTGRIRKFFPSRRTAFISFVSGALAALGHDPWSLWPLTLLGFGILFVLHEKAPSPKTAASTVWLFGSGYFAVSLFWIVEPFLVDIARHGWMAPFALLLMSTGLALLWVIPGYVAARSGTGFLRSIFLAGGISAFEFLRSILFTGFPWALPAYVWADTPLIQLSAIFGPFGLTLFTLFSIATSARLVIRRDVILVAAMAALMPVIWFGSAQMLPDHKSPKSGKTARLLQPNAAQHLKWKADMIPVFFNRQIEMTSSARLDGVDMVVWPEMAVGYRLNQTPAALELIAVAAEGVPVLFGGNSVVDDKFRNSLAYIGPSGGVDDWYYKHHLVPFGEYIPFGEALGRVGIRGLAAQDGAGYDVGEGPKLLDVAGIGKVLPLICYELIFPRHLRTDTRPDVIVQITNDAWFGEISGPYQHLAQAQFRAVEQGLPLLRSANTGITAAIDPYGRIISQLALNEEGYIDVEVPAPLPPTVYAKWGELPFFALLTFILTGAAGARALGRRHV